MWDVKENKIMWVYRYTLQSFTLTMWDVKRKIDDETLERLKSFTLTMWDVKTSK